MYGGFTPGKYTHITSITLNKNELTLNDGESEKLVATIAPTNTTDSSKITWTSSNDYIAKVDENGNVTSVSGGIAIITAKTSNGLTAKCEVTSNAPIRYLKGDINQDGIVNAVDVSYGMRGIIHKITLTDTEKNIGDVNEDGVFNVVDINNIMRYILGKIEEL